MTDQSNSKISVDADNKATEILFLSMKRPYMRAFYVAMITMFVGMAIWFSIPPLQLAISGTLDGVTTVGLSTASTFSVVGAMISRVVVGEACDRYGARLPMTIVLLVISVSTGLTAFVRDDVGLAVCRFFSGFGGSTLVIANYWVASMFSKNILGTASSIVLGFGYAGGGFINALLGGILPLLTSSMGEGTAWKVALSIPAVMGVLAALVAFFLADDTPSGKRKSVANKSDNLSSVESKRAMLEGTVQAACNRGTWILAYQYGCSAGTIIGLLNVSNIYFQEVLQLNSSAASYISSATGWLCVTCLVGGYLSDKALVKYGKRGRCYIQSLNLMLQGIFLLIFSFQSNAASATVFFVLTGMLATWACGSTFALIPYVDSAVVGSVSGIVGTVGSLGGVVLIQLTGTFASKGEDSTHIAFAIFAGIVLLSSVMSFLFRFSEDTEKVMPTDGVSLHIKSDLDHQKMDVEKQDIWAAPDTEKAKRRKSIMVRDVGSGSESALDSTSLPKGIKKSTQSFVDR